MLRIGNNLPGDHDTASLEDDRSLLSRICQDWRTIARFAEVSRAKLFLPEQTDMAIVKQAVKSRSVPWRIVAGCCGIGERIPHGARRRGRRGVCAAGTAAMVPND